MRQRCTVLSRRTGEQCKRTAPSGEKLCFYHAKMYRHPEVVTTYAVRNEGRDRWWREVYPIYVERGLAHLVQPGRPKGKMVRGIGRAYQVLLRAKGVIMAELELEGGDLKKPRGEMSASEKLATDTLVDLDIVQDELDRLGRLAGRAEMSGELEEARKASVNRANVALNSIRIQVRVDENAMRGRKVSALAQVLEAFGREVGGDAIEHKPSKPVVEDL